MHNMEDLIPHFLMSNCSHNLDLEYAIYYLDDLLPHAQLAEVYLLPSNMLDNQILVMHVQTSKKGFLYAAIFELSSSKLIDTF